MLFDEVRRFVSLSNRFGVKGSNPQVKELMTLLRRSGFTSSDINELSGGKWSSTLVRQYTSDWGGVDKELDEQRTSLMTSLRELVSSGNTIEDVEHVLTLERSVRAKGSSLEEVSELNSNLRDLDMRPREIVNLVSLSRELMQKRLSLDVVQYWMSLDQELVENGLSREARGFLVEVCARYGGVPTALIAVNEFNNLTDIRSEHARLEREVASLSSEKDDLDETVIQNRRMIEAVNNAYYLGFDVASLTMISVLAMDLGGPYKVAEAIQKYGSIMELDQALGAKKADLEVVEKDISHKASHFQVLNYSLNEAKEVYDRGGEVRLVVELLVNPRGIQMNRSEVVGLLGRVLACGVDRIEANSGVLDISDPEWSAIYESIKSLAMRLSHYSQI
jgi:hypothetical protein